MTLLVPTLRHPFNGGGLARFEEKPLLWLALLISGWINVLFIVALFYLTRERQQMVRLLRIVLLLMLPACWIVFDALRVRPQLGFVSGSEGWPSCCGRPSCRAWC